MALLNGIKIITSDWCFEYSDEYEDKEVQVKRGGFWERLWEIDPTLHLWDDYKTVTVKVPKKKPVMYMFNGDTLMVHPALMDKLINSLIDIPSSFGTLSSAKKSSYSMDDFRKTVAMLENFK